jgi:hypothetical protein
MADPSRRIESQSMCFISRPRQSAIQDLRPSQTQAIQQNVLKQSQRYQSCIMTHNVQHALRYSNEAPTWFIIA